MFAVRHYFSPAVPLQNAINLTASNTVSYFFLIGPFYLTNIQYMSCLPGLPVLLQKRSLFFYAHISNLIRKYFEEGLPAVSEKHYAGNRRNMSIEEETAFLEQYRQSGKAGQILDVREMKMAYEERVGHSIGSSQIYRVLERHGWRKVMPRSKHPKRASEEVIATSKK